MTNLNFLKERGIPPLGYNGIENFDDGTRKAFAAHIINYHYLGDHSYEHTEQVFRDFYQYNDVDAIWGEILKILQDYPY